MNAWIVTGTIFTVVVFAVALAGWLLEAVDVAQRKIDG
jgi:hypothetical protein